MKNLLSIILLALLFISCNSEQKPIPKIVHVSEYIAIKEGNKFVKGDIKLKYTLANYENGSQKYFAPEIGYSNNDTLWVDKKELSEKK